MSSEQNIYIYNIGLNKNTAFLYKFLKNNGFKFNNDMECYYSNTGKMLNPHSPKKTIRNQTSKFVKKVVKAILPYAIIKLRRIYKDYKEELNLPKPKHRELLRFDIHAADHCNINCASCEHFSPLAQKKLLDVGKYEQDLAQLAKISNGIAEEISILGGEPLLHPDIIKIMELSRKYFLSAVIRIFTNGLLLLKQEDDFWECLVKHNITLFISVYPVRINFLEIWSRAMHFGVSIVFSGNITRQDVTTFRKLPIDLNGRQDAHKSNALCYASNYCFQLVDGKLYKCWRIAYISYFNSAFGQNLPVTEKDYFDIYKETDIKNILNEICKPAPFCKYCDMTKASNIWTRSRKELTEWV